MKITARGSAGQLPIRRDIFISELRRPSMGHLNLEVWEIDIPLEIKMSLGALAKCDPFSRLVSQLLIGKYTRETIVLAGRTPRIQAIQTADEDFRAKGWRIYSRMRIG